MLAEDKIAELQDKGFCILKARFPKSLVATCRGYYPAHCAGNSFLRGTARIALGSSTDRTFILCRVGRASLLVREEKRVVSPEAPPNNQRHLNTRTAILNASRWAPAVTLPRRYTRTARSRSENPPRSTGLRPTARQSGFPQSGRYARPPRHDLASSVLHARTPPPGLHPQAPF